MADITTQQLAQLLLGIARAQHAMADAIENLKTGFKTTHFRPAVETAARIRANRPETLADYPSRLLLQMLGRTPPDADAVLRDLQNLLSPPQRPASAAGPGAAEAASAGASASPATPGPGDDAASLDMTR
jgi:hypothetical protein